MDPIIRSPVKPRGPHAVTTTTTTPWVKSPRPRPPPLPAAVSPPPPIPASSSSSTTLLATPSVPNNAALPPLLQPVADPGPSHLHSHAHAQSPRWLGTGPLTVTGANGDENGGGGGGSESVAAVMPLTRYPMITTTTPTTGMPLPLALDRDYPVAFVDGWPLTANTALRHHPPPPHQQHHQHQQQQQHHQAAAASSSPTPTAMPSPLSPRTRKAHARHRLFDENKSKPGLLADLEALVRERLARIGQDRTDRGEHEGEALDPRHRPSLQRLEVFREVFARILGAFSVYAPLLAEIKDEYEATIAWLLARGQLVPQLHAELQSLRTQCLQELSEHQLETKRRHAALRQTLAQTQGELTARAAELARLREDHARLAQHAQQLEHRNEEMQLSNHTLVHGMKRHDETLRHIHERSREEAIALQQMTLKYHRACEEIAELKKTIATLEEKVGGVHVAADKATIALLARDLQELHVKYQLALGGPHVTPGESPGAPAAGGGGSGSSSSCSGGGSALGHVLVRVLEAHGVSLSLGDLIELIANNVMALGAAGSAASASGSGRTGSVLALAHSASTSVVAHRPASVLAGSGSRASLAPKDKAPELVPAIERVASVLVDRIRQNQQQQSQPQPQHPHPPSLAGSASASSPLTFPGLQRGASQALGSSPQQPTRAATGGGTFLTEPEEHRASFPSASSSVLGPLLATNDYLPCRGLGPDVPEYLQYEGVVRHLHFDRRRVETIVTKVWQHKDELDKTRRTGASAAPGSGSGTTTTTMMTTPTGPGLSGPQQVPLARAFALYLQRGVASRHEAVEAAYNVIAGLERFEGISSDCRLFLLVLQGQLPEDARQDQVRELYAVHDALFAIHREQRNHAPGQGPAGTASGGGVGLAEVIQTLRRLFPWKENAALSALHRAILLDQRGSPSVDYAALLLQHEDKRLRPRSCFCEALRTQYIDDLLAFRRHLQAQIHRALATASSSTSTTPTTTTTTMLPLAAATTGGVVGGNGASQSGGSDTSQTAEGTAEAETPATSAMAAPTTTLPVGASAPEASATGTKMISIRALRECLQDADPAKPVQEINRLLAVAAGLTMEQILTQDAMMLSAAQFIGRLATLLVKPSGKFATPAPTPAAATGNAAPAES